MGGLTGSRRIVLAGVEGRDETGVDWEGESAPDLLETRGLPGLLDLFVEDSAGLLPGDISLPEDALV